MTTIKLVTVLAVVLSASYAFAHEGMHGPGSEVDYDGNGVLSLAEFSLSGLAEGLTDAQIAELFAHLDLDESFYLTSPEFIRGLAPQG
jgi:hypothetical protein